jgi:hypothetical protein
MEPKTHWESSASKVDWAISARRRNSQEKSWVYSLLFLERFHMIFVYMCISEHMNKLTWHQTWRKRKNRPLTSKRYQPL